MVELYWIYAFNLIINSTLSFFTALLLMLCFTELFRIKHPRARMLCYLVPFCKICLDFFLYHFSKWALLQQINPLIAEKGTRQLSLMVNPWMGVQLSMKEGMTFSLADVIALSLDPFWVRAVVCVAGVGILVSLAWYFIQIRREKGSIERILRTATAFDASGNPSLDALMKKQKVLLAISTAIEGPCIVQKTILFPQRLISQLSKEEMQAVIAHELGHHKWRDCAIRLAYSLIAAIFWWIPTKWWTTRIEELQEHASDEMIHRFGIAGCALGQAVLKTAHGMQGKLLLTFMGSSSALKNRVEKILREPRPQVALAWKALQYGLLGLCLLSILLGKLWIF